MDRRDHERRYDGSSVSSHDGPPSFSMSIQLGMSPIVGELPHAGEHFVEDGENRSAVDQFLGVSGEANSSGDEGLLGIERVCCHGHCCLPVLFESHILWISWTGTESRRAVGDLQVIGDITFRTAEHGLGESHSVMSGDFGHLVAVGNGIRQRIDPVETEIAHTCRRFLRRSHVVSLPFRGWELS